jgi:hypothetical protein
MRKWRSVSGLGVSGPLLALAGVLGLMSVAANGCNGYNNVSIHEPHLAAGSPDADDSTAANPVIVMRDNPQFYGALNAGDTVSGTATRTYSSDGKWKNLTGAIRLDAREPTGEENRTDYGPLLPRVGSFQGPGQAEWVSRFGDLIHDNAYRATLNLREGTTNVQSTRPLWVKLSDDVALVPIVVINWKKPGNDTSFRDQTQIAKSMFDFIPYSAPDYVPAALSLNDVKNPNQSTVKIIDPAGTEEPPDEIWSKCNIQTQVVATYTFELPAGKLPECNPALATFESADKIRERIRATGTFGAYVVDKLQPIFVAYGDMGACSGPMGFTGKVVGGSSLAEVNFSRTRVTTSHEIGHILIGGNHHGGNNTPTLGNLMRVNPSNNDRDLTPEQCSAARGKALQYSSRYRTFNRWSGRASVPVSLDDVEPVVTGPVGVPMTCCAKDGEAHMTPAVACAANGGSTRPTSDCNVCCAQGSTAKNVPDNQCAPADVLSDNACDSVCCTTFSGQRPRQECTATGGQIKSCPPVVPQ